MLLTEADIKATPKPSVDPQNGDINLSTYTNYGLGEKEKDALFKSLPDMTAHAWMVSMQQSSKQWASQDLLQIGLAAQTVEAKKVEMLARLVDLRNANAKGIALENRRRIIAAFSEPENPHDPGRPEVQGEHSRPFAFPPYPFARYAISVAYLRAAAIATMRIRNLWSHLGQFKKDISNRRNLRKLVHHRAKILRYLKGVDQDRYDRVLERLGLERSAVEGELVV